MRRIAAIIALASVVLVAGGAAADTFAVTLVSQTSNTITLGWSPQPGYGYLFSSAGVLRSRTYDPNRSTVRFSKVSPASYDVDVITKGANGHYPGVTPPPVFACSDSIDNDGDGKIDFPNDPGCSSATDTSETDPVPPPAQCADTIDNDSDGLIDLADPGCSSAADNDETNAPPTGQQALWIDTNGGSCSRSVGAPYSDGTACGSFGAALAAAQPGDFVTVRGGTYGPQTVSQNKGGARITFQAASGETVNLSASWGQGSLTIPPSGGNVTFRNINASWLNGGDCSGESTNVTFESAQIQSIQLRRAVNWSFVGGGIGPAQSTGSVDAHPLLDDCGVTNNNKNVLFDGVYFHDVYSTSASHTECLLVVGVDGLVIRNSRFFNCDSTGDIYVTRWNFGTANDHGQVENVLIENNFFLDDTGYSGGPAGSSGSQPWSIQLENDSSITFRNNTVTKSLLLLDSRQTCGGCGDPIRPVTIANNYGSTGGCLSGVTYIGNVWHSTPVANSVGCGTPEKPGPVQVVNRQTDLHLVAGADAINQAVMAQAPAKDIDGQNRPIGPAPDAGADEAG